MGDFIISLRNKIWYAVLMGVLALISGGMLVYEFFTKNASQATLQVMYNLDLGIAYLFLLDFLLGVYFAKHKLLHLKKNWLDLLGSIPLSDTAFRALRTLRFVRLMRIFRAFNAGLSIEDSIETFRENRRKK